MRLLSLKKRLYLNNNLMILLLLIVATSVSDGISSVVIPQMLLDRPKVTALVGSLIGIQSLIGVLIFLPQASFIKRKGEKLCIRLSLLINVFVYLVYLLAFPFAVALGKFTEGFGDRLLNSTVSKLIYDETDNHNNRGKVRALMEATTNVSLIVGPAIAAILISFSTRLPILIAIFLMSLVFILSKEIELKSENHNIDTRDNFKFSIVDQYKEHLHLYFKNKNVVWLTIPSILLSPLGVFYSIFLNVYLLKIGIFTIVEIGFLWSIISAVSIVIQIPSGYLADKNKEMAFWISFILFIFGFYGLIFIINSKYYTFIFVLSIYIAGQFYTTSMSALFGDVTTPMNRLSESESYRMVRALGEGIIILIISNVYTFFPEISIGLIGLFAILGVLITHLISKNYYSRC